MKKHIINTVIIILISFGITLFFTGTEDSMNAYLLDLLYGALIGVSFAVGSRLIARLVFAKTNLIEKPLQTYVVLLASIIVFMTLNVTVGEFCLV